MPVKIDICIEYQDKTYCWNYETCRFDVYAKDEPKSVTACPSYVTEALVRILSGKTAAAGENGKSV